MLTWVRDHTHLLYSIDEGDHHDSRGDQNPSGAFLPITTKPPSRLVLPATTAPCQKLLPSFHRLDHEDPYMYMKDFLEFFATFKFQNLSNESVCLRLFPFSLRLVRDSQVSI